MGIESAVLPTVQGTVLVMKGRELGFGEKQLYERDTRRLDKKPIVDPVVCSPHTTVRCNSIPGSLTGDGGGAMTNADAGTSRGHLRLFMSKQVAHDGSLQDRT